jgi:hypothetical protein
VLKSVATRTTRSGTAPKILITRARLASIIAGRSSSEGLVHEPLGEIVGVADLGVRVLGSHRAQRADGFGRH